MANFVVPQASARWYNLGLQLFDPRDEGVLHSMKTQANKSPEEQCTEVFNHWLTTKKNPTWNKLIGSLKSPAVNLPNVAITIENMLDSRVSYCYRLQPTALSLTYTYFLSHLHKLLLLNTAK